MHWNPALGNRRYGTTLHSSSEPTPERLCSAVFVVAVDVALDFGLGLDARGTYGTIFIGKEGVNKEVLQEEAIFGVEIW